MPHVLRIDHIRKSWAVLILLGGLFGCEAPPVDSRDGAPPSPQPATSQPMADNATATEPLPPKATTSLQSLLDETDTPTSKEYSRDLPKAAADALQTGQEKLAEGNVTAAVEKLERAKDYDPNHPAVRRALGEAYTQLPNLGKAAENLRAAEEYQANDLDLQVTLARLAMLQKQYDSAVEHYLRALKTDDANPDKVQTAYAMLWLGRVLEAQGYWTAALEAYQRLDIWLIEHGTEYGAESSLEELLYQPHKLLAMQGRLHVKLRHPAKAMDLLEKAYKRDRTDSESAQQLVELYIQAGKYRQAEDILIAMAGREAHAGMVAPLLETLLQASKDTQAPKRFWEAIQPKRAEGLPDALQIGLVLSQSASELGAEQDARAILADLRNENPDNDKIDRMQAEVEARTGQPQRAMKRLAGLLALKPELADVIRNDIREIHKAGLPEDFLRSFSQVTYQDTSQVKHALHHVAGLLAELDKNYPLAADHYRRAIDAKSDFTPSYEALLRVFQVDNRQQAFADLLARLDKVLPEGYLYQSIQGQVLLQEGKLHQAEQALTKAKDKNPDHVPTLLNLAEVYNQLARQATNARQARDYSRQAEQMLRRARELHPDAGGVSRKLYEQYLQNGNYHQARQLAEEMTRESPGEPDGWIMLTEIALRQNQHDEAKQIVDDLLTRFPDDPDVLMLTVRLRAGRESAILFKDTFDENVRDLLAIIGDHPDHLDAHQTLAQMLSRPIPGDHEQAFTLWGTTYELSGMELSIGIAYAQSLIRAKKYPQAETLLETLLDRSSETPILRSQYLLVLSEQKNYDEAMDAALSWFKDNPKDQMLFNDYLAVARQAKRYDDAVTFLREQMQNVPVSEHLRLRYLTAQFLIKADRYQDALEEANQGGDRLAPAVYSELLEAGQAKLVLDAVEDKLDEDPLEQNWSKLKLRALIDLQQYDKMKDFMARYRQHHTYRESLGLPALWTLNQAEKPDRAMDVIEEEIAAFQAELDADAARNQADEQARAATQPASQPENQPTSRPMEPSGGQPMQLPAPFTDAHKNQIYTLIVQLKFGRLALLQETGDYNQAAQAAQAYLAEYQDQPDYFDEPNNLLQQFQLEVVRSRMRAGQYTEALQAVETYLNDAPNDPELLDLKGTILSEIGRGKQAIEVLERVYKMRSEDPWANNNFAYFLSEQGIRLTEAEKLARFAFSKVDSLACRDTLAWVFYKQGRFSRAATLFLSEVPPPNEIDSLLEETDDQREQARREQYHCIILDHLGDTLFRLGWTDQALQYWRVALEMARQDEQPGRDTALVLTHTPEKIHDAQAGKPVNTAPLGEGIVPQHQDVEFEPIPTQ